MQRRWILIEQLKSQYSPNNRNQITLIGDISDLKDVPCLQEIFEELKTISKFIEEEKNTGLKNRVLFGGWISVAKRAYRRYKYTKRTNLPRRFDNWMYKECRTRNQRIYNYENLFMLMSVAPKLLNCRVNMTLLKTMKFLWLILIVKNRYFGTTSMIVHAKLVIFTFWE